MRWGDHSNGKETNSIKKNFFLHYISGIWSKDYWIKHEEEVKGQIPISKIGEKYDKVYLFVSRPIMQSNSEDEKLKLRMSQW
jgi:hypothetical protein